VEGVKAVVKARVDGRTDHVRLASQTTSTIVAEPARPVRRRWYNR
jgi:hypothetical protein